MITIRDGNGSGFYLDLPQTCPAATPLGAGSGLITNKWVTGQVMGSFFFKPTRSGTSNGFNKTRSVFEVYK